MLIFEAPDVSRQASIVVATNVQKKENENFFGTIGVTLVKPNFFAEQPK